VDDGHSLIPKLGIPSTESNIEQLPWGMPGQFPPLPVRQGRMRSDFTVLDVETDGEAVAVWIAERGSGSSHTAQAYRREVERLLLWAAKARNKALSELTREDFLAFKAFLADPQPAQDWIADRRYPRNNPNWRPFIGPLSDNSIHQSLVILYGMMSYLVEQGWLRANPMPAPRNNRQRGYEPVQRSLSKQQWSAVQEVVSGLPEQSRKQSLFKARAQWILTFFSKLGPRVSEACSHRMGDITTTVVEGQSVWVWNVTGKGGKRVMLPVPNQVMQALWSFRESLGLSPYPSPNEPVPLVPSFATMKRSGELDPLTLKPLTRNSVYKLVCSLFEQAASLCEEKSMTFPEKSQERALLINDAHALRRASTHWLRHTTLRELADKTGDMRLVQQLGRHSNMNTSARYSTPELEALRIAMNSDRREDN